MQITSESLFHFTHTLKNLENILHEKFKLTYCNEKFEIGGTQFNEHFPMVSFCDLPLGLIKIQIQKYGGFAIGMTKEWGIKNQLNPVLYLEKNSIISSDINSAFLSISRLMDILKESKEKATDIQKEELHKFNKDILQSAKSSVNILRFVKNYKGLLIRGEKKYPDYRFYDEREWRYVPSYDNKLIKPAFTEEEYKKYRGTTKSKPLIEEIVLDFNASDIKYLIVESEKDIPRLIRTIKSIDNLSRNSNETDVLTTKILTSDQIKTDV